MIRWFRLLEAGAVQGPPGIIFSTSPRVGTTADGKQVFVKGPQADVVFAEAVGFGLADMADVDVPVWGMAEVQGEGPLFVSIAAPHRSALDVLLRSDLGMDRAPIAACIALDVWLANPDRNLLNLVAGTWPDGALRFLAIDFEKSMVLRGVSRFILATHSPEMFLPREALRPFCSGLPIPGRIVERIQAIPEGEIRHLVHEVGNLVCQSPDADDLIVDHLLVRRESLQSLIQEVWPCLS